MKNKPTTIPAGRLAATSAAFFLFYSVAAPLLNAQEDDDKLFELSPFVVKSQDQGYMAGSTLAAGRTSTDLRNVSAAVSILTEQFLSDINAINISDVADWTVNTVSNDKDGSKPQDWGISTRGLSTSFPSRNYFLWYVDSDSYNTERIEFSRGPNGVLFGDGEAGGMVTTHTKRPRFEKDFAKVHASINSYDGGYRLRLDANKKVTERFGVRLNTLLHRTEEWQDGNDKYDRDGIHLSAAYRPSDKTEIRLEGERGNREKHGWQYFLLDGHSRWDGTTVADTAGQTIDTATAKAAGIQKVNSNPRPTFINGQPDLGVQQWRNAYATSSSGFTLVDFERDGLEYLTLIDRKANYTVPNNINTLDYWTYTGSIGHRFSDSLYFEIAYNETKTDYHNLAGKNVLSDTKIDVNRQLPNGSPNPNFGKMYSESSLDNLQIINEVNEIRAMAAYELKGDWGKSNINAIAGSREDVFSWTEERVYRDRQDQLNWNGSVWNRENDFFIRTYLEDAASTPFPTDFPIEANGFTYDWLPSSLTAEVKELNYMQLASSTSLLSRKLNLYFGLRYDELERQKQEGWRQQGKTARNLPELGYNGVVGEWNRDDFELFSKSGGAVYYLRPWMGLSANYSESFQAPFTGNPLITGEDPDVMSSEGTDLGFKFVLVEGKLFATASYYDVEQTARPDYSNSRSGELRRLWEAMGTFAQHPEATAYRDTRSYVGTGYEFELMGNPTQNIRFTANIAFPRTEAIDLQPGLTGYMAEHTPTWTAEANRLLALDPADPVGLRMLDDIDIIEFALSSNEPGVSLNGTHKYTANLYGTYRFLDGGLRNIEFGLGTNIRGKRKIGSLADAFDYFYTDAYFLMSSHIRYSKDFEKFNFSLQLNVSNLLDNDDWIAGGMHTQTEGGVVQYYHNNWRPINPRKFTLSTSFAF